MKIISKLWFVIRKIIFDFNSEDLIFDVLSSPGNYTSYLYNGREVSVIKYYRKKIKCFVWNF